MTDENLNNWFQTMAGALEDALHDHDAIEVYDDLWDDPADLAPAAFEPFKDPLLPNFYQFFGQWRLHWKTAPDASPSARGGFRFLPFQESKRGGPWVTYGDLEEVEWTPALKGYRPVDLFFDADGHAGMYVGDEDKRGMYVVGGSGTEVYPLHVDLRGYLELLRHSKGYGWWQYVLVNLATDKDMPGVAKFKEVMPALFPEFKFEDFAELYGSLRIDQ